MDDVVGRSGPPVVTDKVEFLGAEFRMGERVGLMPMMRYARVAKRLDELEKSGGEADGDQFVEMFDATLSLLEQCVHPDDWSRFERHSTEQGADQEEFMEFAGRVMAALSDRPTGPRSVSSSGPRTIEPSSTDGSSSQATGPSRVVQKFNDRGRPDLALLVRKREESLTA